MLKRIMAVLGQAVELCRLLKDIECGMDGSVADNVDAHGVAALGCRQNQLAHALGGNRQTTLVAREARVGIGLSEVCGMLARHAVEELLKARRREQRIVCVAGLKLFQARLVIQQRGEQVGANAQLAARLKLVVDVVADKVAARHGHERHVANRGNALLGHAFHLVGIRARDAILAQPLKTARQQLHGRSLVSDTRGLAICIFVVAATRRRLTVTRHAKCLERAAVEPQRVPVARVHNTGAIGKSCIERRLGGMLGRIPTVIAPALRHDPGVVGQVLGKLERVPHQRRL